VRLDGDWDAKLVVKSGPSLEGTLVQWLVHELGQPLVYVMALLLGLMLGSESAAW
jgi:hypothetical protein